MPKPEKVKINVKDRIDDNSIDLSLSELTEAPIRDIAGYKRVLNVDLSNNKIISLKNVSLLSHITKLDLSKNELKYLPEDFGSLKTLRHLDLYNNRLVHLPLSFGNLQNLRYLDLKANPLTPPLAKIVGQCLTTKDCNESAKNTVKFLKQMLLVYEKAKEKLKEEKAAEQRQIDAIENAKRAAAEAQKSKKKRKLKSKKSKTNQNGLDNDFDLNTKYNTKNNKIVQFDHTKNNNPKTALKTVFVFFFLLAINILVIYLLTVKNPEIAEKLVEIIPTKYREIILSKSENIKLNFFRISDWIHQFRTPPEEDFAHYIGKS